MINHPFSGYQIEVSIRPSPRLTQANRRSIKKDSGQVSVQRLQGECAVAEAVGEALGATYSDRNSKERLMTIRESITFGDGRIMRLNPNARPRFGVDSQGRLSITVSLVEQDAAEEHDKTRWRLTWHDRDIPRKFAQTAIDHDEGRPYQWVRGVLNCDDADVAKTKYVPDPRPKGPEANRRKNHAHGQLVEVAQRARTRQVKTRIRDRQAEEATKKAKKAEATKPPVQPTASQPSRPPATSTVTRKHRRPSCVDLDQIYGANAS